MPAKATTPATTKNGSAKRVNVPAPQIASTPMEMLAGALAGGQNPADLEKLMDLAERFESNQARKSYAVAMAEAQSAMPCVIREKENSHTRSKYASLEQVQATIKPVYLAHGFTVSFGEVPHEQDEWICLRAIVRHRDGHQEEFHRNAPMDTKGPKGNNVKSALHGSQSTVSYLSRTMLLGIFGVTVADYDIDGSHEQSPEIITEAQADGLVAMFKQLDDGKEYADEIKRKCNIVSIGDLPVTFYAPLKKKLAAKMEGGDA